MNIEYFIAKRLFSAKEKNNSYTKPIFSIAIFAIALSVAVMLISIMVVTGFKKDISDKIIGFSSHIEISKYSYNHSYESEPINIKQDFYSTIINNKGIDHINVFATKAGIIKTASEIQGVLLKGVSSDYDWSFFEKNLVRGDVFTINDSLKSNNILISEITSKTLGLDVNDDLIMYFVQKPPRVRKFKISGIYNTSMSDFDKLYVVSDIKHIQVLNDWKNNEVGGFEVSISNFDNLDENTALIYDQIPQHLNAESVKERLPQIFDWLDLQDINVRVILIFMLLVAAINMITALLILIIDQTRLIGILKALGASNFSIRRVFLYYSVHLISKGVIFGNLFALFFAFLQKKYSIIKLDPSTYYMNAVPINLNIVDILLLNIGTIFLCYFILILPSLIISKITPIKAIRFE